MRTGAVLLLFAVLALAADAPWKKSEEMRPEDLASQIKAGKAKKMLVFHVGFPVMYRGKHIPGAIFAGPGSKPDGLTALKLAVRSVPRNREILLYCGCCPWGQCPNVRPAFSALKEMGFTKVKVLVIPNDFARDWVEKGFPAE